MYNSRSLLRTFKQMDLLVMFIAGATAKATAEIVAVQCNTSTSFSMRFHHFIAGKLSSFRLSEELEKMRITSEELVRKSEIEEHLAK
jgi:hypothetical protein